MKTPKDLFRLGAILSGDYVEKLNLISKLPHFSNLINLNHKAVVQIILLLEFA
jgi:hypothetical protein